MALTLRNFTLEDLNDFSALHADPKVMKDLGGPITRAEAQEKISGYIAAQKAHGYARMAVFQEAQFAGYVGVMHHDGTDHPLGPHDEIGWRILPAFWGQGIATRAAQHALTDAFERAQLTQILAYTQPENLSSQAVMHHLGMTRRPDLDFEEHYPPLKASGGLWRGLTWSITATDWAAARLKTFAHNLRHQR